MEGGYIFNVEKVDLGWTCCGVGVGLLWGMGGMRVGIFLLFYDKSCRKPAVRVHVIPLLGLINCKKTASFPHFLYITNIQI